jgi:hypothetical protein
MMQLVLINCFGGLSLFGTNQAALVNTKLDARDIGIDYKLLAKINFMTFAMPGG